MFVMIVLMFIPTAYADYYFTEPMSYDGIYDGTNLTGNVSYYSGAPEPWDTFGFDINANYESDPTFQISMFSITTDWNQDDVYWRRTDPIVIGIQIMATQNPTVVPKNFPGEYKTELLASFLNNGYSAYLKVTPLGNGIPLSSYLSLVDLIFPSGSIDLEYVPYALIGDIRPGVNPGSSLKFGAAPAPADGPPAVPEPATVISFLLGGAGLAVKRFLKKRKA